VIGLLQNLKEDAGEIMEKNRRSAGHNDIWKIMLGILLAAAAIGMMIAGVRIYRQSQAEARLEQLAESTISNRTDTSFPEAAVSGSPAAQENGITQESPAAEAPPETEKDPLQVLEDMGIPVPEKEVDFADLQANVNPDIYAWIYIPDTLIDYPVLQHPTDNYYYLNYNLDGSRGYPGCIYTEDYNAKDFSDPNTVIYGHNMKNGTMFAGLHKFEDGDYFAEHPYVYIYTEEKLYVYEIFAAYESGNEHILYSHDFSSASAYSEYLEDVFAVRAMNSNIRKDVEVTSEDCIITLSTCVANKSDRRYLVQGVLLNEG